MSKVIKDNENSEWIPVRVLFAIILTLNIAYMFFIEPTGMTDKFAVENLWEAVHPFSFFDGVALVANLFVYLYLGGLANKVIKPIYEWVQPKGENSFGLTRVIFWVCVLLMLLYFV